MLEDDFRPVRCRVAGVAGFAIVAVMLVIFEMAGHAVHLHRVLKRMLRVAVIAA